MNIETTGTTAFYWRDVPIPYRCEGCPYPRVGFICRDRDGTCTRTDVERLTERQRRMRGGGCCQLNPALKNLWRRCDLLNTKKEYAR